MNPIRHMFDDHPLEWRAIKTMPQLIMNHYDSVPTNGILSAASGLIAFIVSGVDPVVTGIVMPILFFAIGKGLDIAVKVWLDRRRR